MASATTSGRRGALGALRFVLARSSRFVLVASRRRFSGSLAVTFFIGRVVPIDPVLAIVGDRAPPHVYDRARQELGLDLPLVAAVLDLLQQGR